MPLLPAGDVRGVGDGDRRRARRRRVLIGAWAVAPLAGEWIHYAALVIKTHAPLGLLRDTVAQFPTYREASLEAIEALELR
jgi:pyruvate/2-oxoglutarate dehydrogenase complex dihydrolipoamide dehydrogenase (E3) component